MLRAVMAEILAPDAAKRDTRSPEQAGGSDILSRRPAGRTVGGDIARLACPPDRSEDRGSAAEQSTAGGDGAGLVEDDGCIGVERETPGETPPWRIDRNADQTEQEARNVRVVDEVCSRPSRRRPAPRACTRHSAKVSSYLSSARNLWQHNEKS